MAFVLGLELHFPTMSTMWVQGDSSKRKRKISHRLIKYD